MKGNAKKQAGIGLRIAFAFSVVLFIFFATGCALDPSLESKYLRAVISQDDIRKYAVIEVPGPENIKLVTENGVDHLELRLYPLQPLKNNGIRAELSIDPPYKEGDSMRYSWEFRMPKDFVSDAPQNRWWIFADWHVQPDTNKGETWDNFNAGSSPVQFGYGMLDGKDLLSLSVGSNTSPVGLIPFTREVWHSVRIDITWSTKSNGRTSVYFDGATTPTLSTNSENMKNAAQHYMKIGQYRNREIFTENKIHIRNILISKILN